MQNLYYQILNTVRQYQKFIEKEQNIQKSTPKGPMNQRFEPLKIVQEDLLYMATDLIQGRLQFLQEFLTILIKINEMHNKLVYEIQQNSPQSGAVVSFINSAESILQMGKRILQEGGKFLLLKYDLQFLCQLNNRGVSMETIRKIIYHNIRRYQMESLTDEQFDKLGIQKLGDLFCLQQLRNGQ